MSAGTAAEEGGEDEGGEGEVELDEDGFFDLSDPRGRR